jgi:hypothetical protein
MWLINFLPDWIFYLLLIIGILAIVVSMFLKNIPVVGHYQTPIWLLGILLTVVGVWFAGGISQEREYRERISALQLRVAAAEKKSAEANTQIEYVYRDRVQIVEKVRYQVISAIREYSTAMDANCTVIPLAVDILNQATQSNTGEKKK